MNYLCSFNWLYVGNCYLSRPLSIILFSSKVPNTCGTDWLSILVFSSPRIIICPFLFILLTSLCSPSSGQKHQLQLALLAYSEFECDSYVIYIAITFYLIFPFVESWLKVLLHYRLFCLQGRDYISQCNLQILLWLLLCSEFPL